MKDLVWVGKSLHDLCEFPDEVKNEIGYALYEAQSGLKYSKAKPLTGIESGVMEIKDAKQIQMMRGKHNDQKNQIH